MAPVGEMLAQCETQASQSTEQKHERTTKFSFQTDAKWKFKGGIIFFVLGPYGHHMFNGKICKSGQNLKI